uniref:Uncharacterized protein n=1 Tax=Rhizophora mucronata TaxID=61149 RepID=A0A2P2K311_RHIMU
MVDNNYAVRLIFWFSRILFPKSLSIISSLEISGGFGWVTPLYIFHFLSGRCI